MHLLINALLLAVLLPGTSEAPQPTCRAKLKGALLTTSIQFQNGYTLEAPWQVVQTQRAWLSDEKSMLVVDLSLDRIVELDELTGERSATPLPHPVRVQVEAQTEPEIVKEAANTWCSTVIKARGTEAGVESTSLPKPGRIT